MRTISRSTDIPPEDRAQAVIAVARVGPDAYALNGTIVSSDRDASPISSPWLFTATKLGQVDQGLAGIQRAFGHCADEALAQLPVIDDEPSRDVHSAIWAVDSELADHAGVSTVLGSASERRELRTAWDRCQQERPLHRVRRPRTTITEASVVLLEEPFVDVPSPSEVLVRMEVWLRSEAGPLFTTGPMVEVLLKRAEGRVAVLGAIPMLWDTIRSTIRDIDGTASGSLKLRWVAISTGALATI